MIERKFSSTRRAFLRESTAIALGLTLPGAKSDAALLGLPIFEHGCHVFGESRIEICDQQGRLLVSATISNNTSAEREATTKCLVESFGANYLLRSFHSSRQYAGRNAAPIDCRIDGPMGGCTLGFTVYPPEAEEGEDANSVTQWYVDEYRLNPPGYWLLAKSNGVPAAESSRAELDAIGQLLSISPLIESLSEIEGLLVIECALRASDYGWDIEQITWD